MIWETLLDVKYQLQIERIHESPVMAVIAITGGGASALDKLLAVSGASRTIIDAVVPYSKKALHSYLDYQPSAAVSLATATDMARVAYYRALGFESSGVSVVGIGCTASIRTNRVKRGEHACFVAAWTDKGSVGYGVKFLKGLRQRVGEEEVVSDLVIRALSDASGVNFDINISLDPREDLKITRRDHADLFNELESGDVGSITIKPDGSMLADYPYAGGLLSGSFYPLHKGHLDLSEVAEKLLAEEVMFELSINNVDKPPLARVELKKRITEITNKRAVVVTMAPSFRDKAKLFPKSTFVIGWDTVVRLFDPAYYGGSTDRMVKALSYIRDRGCRFLVAGRVDNGTFRSLSDVDIPVGFENMMSSIPENEFRVDMSSTRLRAKKD